MAFGVAVINKVIISNDTFGLNKGAAMGDAQYRAKIRLANRRELKILKALVKKYGKGNVPLEEACKFGFKWMFVLTQ